MGRCVAQKGILAAVVALSVALFGCIRDDALYPVLMPGPVMTPGTVTVSRFDKFLAEKFPDPPPQETSAAQENRPEQTTDPQPPAQEEVKEEPPPEKQAASPPRGFHSYFINREVRSDNIGMFPRWTGMLSRFYGEAQTFDSVCGPQKNSPCKLKEWKDFLEGLREAPIVEKLEEINRFLNKYPYVDDIVNWGFVNYWETPYEFQRKSGNCKDYAIAKFMSLRALGVPNDMMRITVLKDLNLGGIIHAVLVVSVGEKSYMLDNQIKQVVTTDKVYHYVPIYSINEEHWWQHFMLQ